jgi:hypothetical protein
VGYRSLLWEADVGEVKAVQLEMGVEVDERVCA